MTIAKDTPVFTSVLQQVAAAWSVDHTAYPYGMYALSIDYHDGFSVVPQPLAGPDGTQVAHIKLQSAYSLVTVTWSAARAGEHPACPNPAPPPGSNFVLLDRHTTPSAPQLHPDGATRLYAITGVYTYSLVNPMTGVGGLPMGAMPFDATPAVLYVYSALDFRNTIFPLT